MTGFQNFATQWRTRLDKIEFSSTFRCVSKREKFRGRKIFDFLERKSGRKRNVTFPCIFFLDRYRWKTKKWKREEKFPLLWEVGTRGEKRISCPLNNKFIAKERANSFTSPRLKRSIVLGQAFLSRESSVNEALGGLTSAINWAEPTSFTSFRLSRKFSVALEISVEKVKIIGKKKFLALFPTFLLFLLY